MRGLVVGILVCIAAVGAVVGSVRHFGRAHHKGADRETVTPRRVGGGSAKPVLLVERVEGALRQAVQDPATAAVGRRLLLSGGLTATDVSTDEIVLRATGSERLLGHLPTPQHDAAAVTLGGAVYVFGGGTGVVQLDHILRVDPRTGAVVQVGRLPSPSSDLAAAAIGGVAYVVGGFTGTRWLDTIVAWSPGAPPRIAARLRTPLRYAAVTAAAGKLVIAGGSTPAGMAARSVMVFDPKTHRLQSLGVLPAPTTHAAAASLGRFAYVIGGRGSTGSTPTSRIVAIDPVHGTIRRAGRLVRPLSDLGAAAIGSGIMVAGGRTASSTVAGVGELVPRRP